MRVTKDLSVTQATFAAVSGGPVISASEIAGDINRNPEPVTASGRGLFREAASSWRAGRERVSNLALPSSRPHRALGT